MTPVPVMPLHSFVLSAIPVASAMAVTASQPMLCLVPAYFVPGLPRPMIKNITFPVSSFFFLNSLMHIFPLPRDFPETLLCCLSAGSGPEHVGSAKDQTPNTSLAISTVAFASRP